MVLTLLAALLTAPIDDPPVKLWLNQDGYFFPGDRARVRVQVAQDGYLVVLRADADGRLRVLFPRDPADDGRVQRGRRFEVRGRGDREAFWVEERDGTGVVLAAWSATPFRFDEFVRGTHWDYRMLAIPDSGPLDDPEYALLDVVQRMASDGAFEYDVVPYTVGAAHAYRRGGRYGRYAPVSLRIGFGWGWPYSYRPGFRYGSCYDPLWYDPFFCGSRYAPIYYGVWYDPFYYDAFFFRSSLYRRPSFYWRRTYVYTGGVFDSRLGHGPLRFNDRVVTDRGIGPRFRAPAGVLLREARGGREYRVLRDGSSRGGGLSRFAPAREASARVWSGGSRVTSRPRTSSGGTVRARPSSGSRGSAPARGRGRPR